MTPSGFQTATFSFVAQCVKQLFHRVPREKQVVCNIYIYDIYNIYNI